MAIVDALYGGTGLVASQFQPPALWGYNRELKDYEYSPSQAQALLREAGQSQGLSDITWEDGKKEPLVFWYMSRSRPYFPNPKEIAEAMAADLAKVGIKTQLQTTEWAVYLDKRKNGQMPLYMLGWTGDNGDPDNFLCYFFCRRASRARASTPTSRWPTCCCAPRSSRSSRSARSSTGRPSSCCTTTPGGSSSPTISRRSRSRSA